MSRTWRKQDIFKLIVITLLLLATAYLFFPFSSEILLAAVFALAMEPSLGRLLRSRASRWKFMVAGILALTFGVLAIPISLAGYKAYTYFVEVSHTGVQNTDAFKKLAAFRDQLVHVAKDKLHTFHLDNAIDFSGISEDSLSRFGNFVMEISTRFIYHIPQVLLSLFVFVVALYFFVAEAKLIKDSFLKLNFLTKTESDKMISILQEASFNTVVTSVSLGFLTATIVALFAVFLDAGDFTIIFVITFICSFIPIIGSGPVALVLGLYKLVMGSTGAAIGFLCAAVLVGFVDNALRPFLISSRSGEDLHPVLSLLALIGALEVFGMPGIFLGPTLASSAIKLVPVFYPRPQPATTVVASPEKKSP